MGKPFLSELATLGRTYEWLMNFNVSSLASAIESSACFPLIACGSGGSMTAATLAAAMHQTFTGNLAKVATPLELVSTLQSAAEIAVDIISAGGKNPDVIAALTATIRREPRKINVICSTVNSPLSRIAARFPFIDFIEFNNPAGRDGFLATNSLFAFCGLLTKGHFMAFGRESGLPLRFDDMAFNGLPERDYVESMKERFDNVLSRNTFVVLFGERCRPAAIDLESKFTEAGLGAVQLADFRNFAHGRHHWLAKHGKDTGVIAFVTPEDDPISQKTLALLPKSIPSGVIDIPDSRAVCSLRSIIATFYLTHLAGLKRGIDPGRPGVPPFGRKIYHLRAFIKPKKQTIVDIAVYRKSRAHVEALDSEEKQYWESAARKFLRRMQRAQFGAVAFDYDGTLCDQNRRKEGIDSNVAAELARLMKGGITVGIATGRGDSVWNDLRNALPKQLWGKIIVGYHNGAQVGRLDAPTVDSTRAHPHLSRFRKEIINHKLLNRIARWKFGQVQITAYPHPTTKFSLLWDAAMQEVIHNHPDLTLVRSGHSLDILQKGVSKEVVVRHLKESTRDGLEVLCIGDSGRWPGNDHALLNTPFSLSVDEGSLNPETCWNVAPEGFRGVASALYYLRSLKIESRFAKLSFHE